MPSANQRHRRRRWCPRTRSLSRETGSRPNPHRSHQPPLHCSGQSLTPRSQMLRLTLAKKAAPTATAKDQLLPHDSPLSATGNDASDVVRRRYVPEPYKLVNLEAPRAQLIRTGGAHREVTAGGSGLGLSRPSRQVGWAARVRAAQSLTQHRPNTARNLSAAVNPEQPGKWGERGNRGARAKGTERARTKGQAAARPKGGGHHEPAKPARAKSERSERAQGWSDGSRGIRSTKRAAPELPQTPNQA